MKKIILAVILLAAAGGATYYLLQKKKQVNPADSISKELVTGKWKIDSLVAKNDSTENSLALLLFAMDSTAKKQVYDFHTDGKVIIALPDDSLAKKDTSSFAWGKQNEFLWKEGSADSTAESLKVIKLDNENFVLQSADSILVYFKRAK